MAFDAGNAASLLGESRLLRADNGCEVPIEELARSGERALVRTFDDRLRMMARPVATITAAGLQDSLKIRLASGRVLDMTSDSSLKMLDGWKRLGQLTPGDRVVVPRRVPEPAGVRRMADDEVVLLAHMIGDGSCVKNQPIRYASIDEQNLRAVTNAAKHFGVTAKRDDYAAARVTTLRLPAPFHLTHGVRNPIAAWLDLLGLFGKRSYEKFVPDVVFAAPNEQVALFLQHLWATDGSVSWDIKQNIARVYYGSTSRRLIEDVRHLLLRLGISSRSHRTEKAGYRDSWQLAVSGATNQRRFLRLVDAHGLKYFAAREVLSKLKDVKANENVDTVPSEVWDAVRQRLRDQGMSHRAFADAMGTKFCGNAMWKPSPSRSRLHRAAAILNDRGLHDLTTNDVFWDRVVEIIPIADREFYRVVVDGANNIVADGVSVRAT